jgi:hypothetical protein
LIGDGERVEARLSALENAVAAHEDAILGQRLAAFEKQRALDEALAQCEAVLAGLRADPTLMRWHTAAVDALEETFRSRSAAGAQASDVSALATEMKEQAAELVSAANKAQIKADQRDYVAGSIAAVLRNMGFIVTGPTPEYTDHPASAVFVTGASPSGKAVIVSVPIEGQIWYNVEGYVKTVESQVGGGTAAVCDEAEQVILDMHDALEAEFSLKMGELTWEGKDPNRVLRQAKSTPDESSRGAGR